MRRAREELKTGLRVVRDPGRCRLREFAKVCGQGILERIAAFADRGSVFALQLAINDGGSVLRSFELGAMCRLARDERYWKRGTVRGHGKNCAISGFRSNMSSQFIMHMQMEVARYVCPVCEVDLIPCAFVDYSESKNSVRNLKGFDQRICYMCNISRQGYVRLGKATQRFDRFVAKPCEHVLEAKHFKEIVGPLKFVRVSRIFELRSLSHRAYEAIYRCDACKQR